MELRGKNDGLLRGAMAVTWPSTRGGPACLSDTGENIA
jgi:hypothetical protein